jgi:hypothetical protein
MPAEPALSHRRTCFDRSLTARPPRARRFFARLLVRLATEHGSNPSLQSFASPEAYPAFRR